MSGPERAGHESEPGAESGGAEAVLSRVLLPASARPRAPAVAGGELQMGEVTATVHPVMAGRVRVSVPGAEPGEEAWVPVLAGVSVREGDRVLLARPANMADPVVIGVLDGFPRRPTPPRPSAGLVLGKGEVVTIAAPDGTALVEIGAAETGPVVRVLQEDVDVELPGKLRVSAASIELVATRGEVKVAAQDDVVVVGENIQLN